MDERARRFDQDRIVLPMPEERFRPNVAALIRSQDGLLLVCERADFPGCWQFPQGGIRKDESPEEALCRELREEVSLKPHHYILQKQGGPYRYRFPDGIKKNGYDGQEQTYFLADLLGPKTLVDVRTESPEFSAIQWVWPTDFDLEWLPPMKREVYRSVFRDILDIELS